MNPLNSDQMPGMDLCRRSQDFTKCLLKANLFFFCKRFCLKNLEIHYIGVCLVNTHITKTLHVMLRKEVADSAVLVFPTVFLYSSIIHYMKIVKVQVARVVTKIF